MTERSNPLTELERLFERMGSQFDEASYRWESQGPLMAWRSDRDPAVDLVDRDDEFVATVDLPGFERGDIDVRVTGRELRVEAEREATDDDETERYVRRERRRRSVRRSIRLPDDVDTEGVEARIGNGVLTVTLPKAEPEPAREVEVEAN